MTTQGKCVLCKVHYEWKGKPLLRDAQCPRCKTKLKRTSCLLQGYRFAVLIGKAQKKLKESKA